MKLYYCGIRKFHFYLHYVAWKSYWDPIYKRGYAELGDACSIVKNKLGEFGELYNEKNPHRFIKFYISKSHILFNLSKAIERKKLVLFKKCGQKFSSRYLKKLKDKDLLKTYNDFFDLLERLFYLNQVVWFLDISGYLFLKDKLLKQSYNIEDIIFLTQPNKKNYLEEEKVEFLKLCQKYFKNKKGINLDNLLENHLKKFAYVGISYYKEPPRKKKDYITQIKRYLKEKRNWQYFKKILEEQQKDFRKKMRMRDKMYNRIKDVRIKKAILILREAAWRKNYFRGSVSEIVYYYFNALLKELAHRLKIIEDQIKTLTDPELKQLIKGERLNWKEINQRQYYYALGTFNHKRFLYYGKRAKQIEDKYFSFSVDKKINELKGVSAQKGVARGYAKIILSYDDFKKFKKGDILVATNTMPEYLPIIRKAKAIVTEIGGITCHAAIVSRELNIPCIIGTKIATKVLKDGDLVEVDAEKGVVRIIKKAK